MSAFCIYLSHYSIHASIYFFFKTQYFFYFSFSGICSIITLDKNINLQNFRYLIIVLFILYFTTSIFQNSLSTISYHLFSTVLFGLTISSFAEKPIRILENKVLTYLGNISYGIYMYHAIMMQFVGFIFLKLTIIDKIPSYFSIILFNLLVLISTIIIAHLSYQYFESYFLNLKKKWIK